jgi:negative regulator of replication initiation
MRLIRELRCRSVITSATKSPSRVPRSTVNIGHYRFRLNPEFDVARQDLKTTALLTYISSQQFRSQPTPTARLLALLGFLHGKHAREFGRVLGVSGAKRAYIARTRMEIEAGRLHTYPQRIPDSDLWVQTNLSHNLKQEVVRRVLRSLGYGESVQARLASALNEPAAANKAAGIVIIGHRATPA